MEIWKLTIEKVDLVGWESPVSFAFALRRFISFELAHSY